MRTFNGGIVFVDKMTLYQLNRQTTLAHTAAAHNNQFIFPQELRDALARSILQGGTRNGRNALSKPLSEVRWDERQQEIGG